MRTIDFTVNASKNGGKITVFNYSHSLNELVGSWSANAVGGTFRAGDAISFDNVMKNGIITRAYKDFEGLWHIEGKDAGVKLMKSTPDISSLPTGENGNAKGVIQALAALCGISLSMSINGLSGFNVRSIISGSTCAEAILELALVSGLIAFINNNGELVLKAPSDNVPTFQNIIDDSGSDIDLDGYATQVLVAINRRKYTEEKETGQEIITGSTPSTNPTRSSVSGSFSGGSYTITTLEPLGVIAESRTSISDNGITISTVEEYEYDYHSKAIWRDNQEYVLFAFIEKSHKLTKTSEGDYLTSKGESLHFKEVTTETLSRSFGTAASVPGIPEDWDGSLGMVSSETLTRSTQRIGGPAPTSNMPDYAPPFDSKITRKFSRKDDGKKLVCDEKEEIYEARQVGSIAPVKLNGENIPHFLMNSDLAIQTHSTPQWVLIKKHRIYYEQYDDDGECIVSTRSEYSDDGAEWLVQNALTDTGDEEADEYQKAYAKFSQQSSSLDVSLGHSALSIPWQFLELQGRTKSTTTADDYDRALGEISEWYDNGQYIRQQVCPHYNKSTKSCNVYIFDALSGVVSPKPACKRSKGTLQWLSCSRALAALERAKEKDLAQLEATIIGSASIPNLQSVGYKREFYIDDNIKDDAAQNIANTIASNILTVKGIKGFRKTVTIPYNPNSSLYQINGVIVEVSHNWENMQTSITYKEAGTIPECLISQSVAGIAAFVSARDTARLNVPQYGVVNNISDDNISVRIANSTISCTTKLNNIEKNDIVLVSFPAGNKLRGQVIARL